MAFRGRSVQLYAAIGFVIAAFCSARGNAEAAATHKIYVFNGRIQGVKPAARSFTFTGDGKSYEFTVTPETRLTRKGKPVPFSTLLAGEDAEVEMKVGPGGKGVALSIKLTTRERGPIPRSAPTLDGPMMDSLCAGTTPGGKRLGPQELKPLVTHFEWPKATHSVIGYLRIKPGVFLLSLAADGGVASVEVLQAIGHRGADADAVKALRKWRFRPNSVREVRVPVQYGFGG